MDLVINDPTTVQQLRQAGTALKLVDKAGNVIGHFVPKAGREPPPLSKEELRRRASEPGRPLANVLADLQRSGN